MSEGQVFGGGSSPSAGSAAGTFTFNPDDYAPASMDWGSLTGG